MTWLPPHDLIFLVTKHGRLYFSPMNQRQQLLFSRETFPDTISFAEISIMKLIIQSMVAKRCGGHTEGIWPKF